MKNYNNVDLQNELYLLKKSLYNYDMCTSNTINFFKIYYYLLICSIFSIQIKIKLNIINFKNIKLNLIKWNGTNNQFESVFTLTPFKLKMWSIKITNPFISKKNVCLKEKVGKIVSLWNKRLQVWPNNSFPMVFIIPL